MLANSPDESHVRVRYNLSPCRLGRNMTRTADNSEYTNLTTASDQPYEGQIKQSFLAATGSAWLKELPAVLQGDDADLLYRQRNRLYRLTDPVSPDGPGLCVKSFRTLPWLRSRIYRSIGSKAQRAHAYSVHLYQQGAAVAEPVGYMERWDGSQLKESYLLTRYLDNATDLYSELNYLLREHPYQEHFVDLLRVCATAIRKMHDSGFLHGDLGPQNILLQRTGPTSWANPTFIDLNRGRLKPDPTLDERARDLERMKLPTHLLHIFYHLYFNDEAVPDAFRRSAEKYRQRFLRHQRSRKFRHPIKTLQHWLQPDQKPQKLEISTGQPPPRELWIWDRHSGQPAVTLKGPDRKRERTWRDLPPLLRHGLKAALPVRRQYRAVKQRAFQQPVRMAGRLGVSVEADERLEEQLSQLRLTPDVPVFVRVYFHLGETGKQQAITAVEALHRAGHEVSIGLIQSRKALQQPDDWQQFLHSTLRATAHCLHAVEIGHAVNRVKWGLWNLQEMQQLWASVPHLKTEFPQLIFLGPPINDFEFQYYPALLAQSPGCFDALSSHLYVDRRGAPENRQGRFSTLEKCTLGNALSNHYGLNGFYITEVNWPLKNTGLASPVAGGYMHQGRAEDPVHVDEATAAAYLVRYALIALCAGTTERIWWWRLAHPGFGLIDDSDNGWRERPAWQAFAWFQRCLGSMTFLSYQNDEGVHLFRFDQALVAYATTPTAWHPPAAAHRLTDLYGNTITPDKNGQINLGGGPVYLPMPPSSTLPMERAQSSI